MSAQHVRCAHYHHSARLTQSRRIWTPAQGGESCWSRVTNSAITQAAANIVCQRASWAPTSRLARRRTTRTRARLGARRSRGRARTTAAAFGALCRWQLEDWLDGRRRRLPGYRQSPPPTHAIRVIGSLVTRFGGGVWNARFLTPRARGQFGPPACLDPTYHATHERTQAVCASM